MKVFIVIDSRSGGISGCFKKKLKAEKYIVHSENLFVKKLKVHK